MSWILHKFEKKDLFETIFFCFFVSFILCCFYALLCGQLGNKLIFLIHFFVYIITYWIVYKKFNTERKKQKKNKNLIIKLSTFGEIRQLSMMRNNLGEISHWNDSYDLKRIICEISIEWPFLLDCKHNVINRMHTHEGGYHLIKKKSKLN